MHIINHLFSYSKYRKCKDTPQLMKITQVMHYIIPPPLFGTPCIIKNSKGTPTAHTPSSVLLHPSINLVIFSSLLLLLHSQLLFFFFFYNGQPCASLGCQSLLLVIFLHFLPCWSLLPEQWSWKRRWCWIWWRGGISEWCVSHWKDWPWLCLCHSWLVASREVWLWHLQLGPCFSAQSGLFLLLFVFAMRCGKFILLVLVF